ncbi:STAS domain-containing protein [Nocardioides sp. KIGAM211]|uniref:STAS domain-containing protein n=1 Tax=Nocardioides luti TaxID=2761101 RepID=A0A7X0VB07_9ACTN|nr:STAS domain-containing protein [Nocardioides luti]
MNELITSSFDEDTAVLTVRGDIDETAGVELRDEITTRSQQFTRTICVDLSAVDYFPSLAVGVVARARSQATKNGVALDLVAAEDSIAGRVLTVCGIDHATA